jgi:hypothetical protein
MAWVTQAVGMALGTVGTIASNLSGDKLRRSLEKSKGSDPIYGGSQDAVNRLGLATNVLNGRSQASAMQDKNILANQGNSLAMIGRNASDGSQALAMGAATQGQTNQAFQNNYMQEMQDYYNRLNNYNGASEAMTADNRAVFDDSVRRWQDIINIDVTKHAIRQQQGQNLSNLGGMIAGSGMGGGASGGGKK